MKLSRRHFLDMLAVSMTLPYTLNIKAAPGKNFRIRTITAGIELGSITDFKKIESVVASLNRAKARFMQEGYEVQTVRLATQPLPMYLSDWLSSKSISAIQAIDEFAKAQGVVLSLGPVITSNDYVKGFGSWAADLIQATEQISVTVAVASAKSGIQDRSIRNAAEAIKAIANSLPGGEGNFRFAATTFVPPGTPFFPAAYHQGEDAFSIGLESPNLLRDVFTESNSLAEASRKLKSEMNSAFKKVEDIAFGISKRNGQRYLGIDTSPAPGPDASIGEAIETLIQAPFGSVSTLSACSMITDVLKGLDVESCGYSGLMLPVVEDRVLAKRAGEGRYSISELLLYSSVCGTGLDVIPLPGEIDEKTLSSIINDVAALANKYKKPLSARLFPIPGKIAGELVKFDNPYLMDSVVMEVH